MLYGMMRNRGCRSGVNVAASGLVAVLLLVLVVSLIYIGVVALIALLVLGVLSTALGRGFHGLADICHRRHAAKS